MVSMYIDVKQGLRDDREVGQVEVFVGSEANPGPALISVAVEPQEIDPDNAEPVVYRVIVTLGTKPYTPILDDRIRRDALLD
jgi:hypothetical protein